MKRDRDSGVAEVEYSSEEIIAIVNDIVASTLPVTERKTEYTKKYPEFVERYPVLFASSCEDNFDYNRFKYMMRMREQVTSNKKTLEDASKEVGQRMFDAYVKPKLDMEKEKGNQ